MTNATEENIEIANFIRSRIIEHYKKLVDKKYRKYERLKADNEYFVHDILTWYFGYEKRVDDNNPPSRVIVGEAVDEYLKDVFKSNEPVITIPLFINGHKFWLTGKPDAIVEYNDTILVIDFKFSNKLSQYAYLQVCIYAWMLRFKRNKKIKCVVVVLKDRFDIYVFDPNYELAEQVVKAFFNAVLSSSIC